MAFGRLYFQTAFAVPDTFVGMEYNKQGNTVRTAPVNIIFCEMALQIKVLKENKKGNHLYDCLFESKVELQGVEPWSKQILQTLSTCLFHD